VSCLRSSVLPVFPVPQREVGGVIGSAAMPCTVVLARSAAGMVHLQPLPMINPGGSPGLAGGMWYAWGERGGGGPGAGGSGAGVNRRAYSICQSQSRARRYVIWLVLCSHANSRSEFREPRGAPPKTNRGGIANRKNRKSQIANAANRKPQMPQIGGRRAPAPAPGTPSPEPRAPSGALEKK
jgi:hypothetical protein